MSVFGRVKGCHTAIYEYVLSVYCYSIEEYAVKRRNVSIIFSYMYLLALDNSKLLFYSKNK